MGDLIAALGFAAAFVGGWLWIARWLKSKGRGQLLSHLFGSSIGALAAFLWVGVLVGLGVLEPAETASDVQAVAQESALMEPVTVEEEDEPATETSVLRELRSEAEALIAIGHEMTLFRDSSEPSDIAQCMDLMERHQPEAEQLRERISAEPDSDDKFQLGMVAVDIRRCVSCVPGAETSCDAASTLLVEEP